MTTPPNLPPRKKPPIPLPDSIPTVIPDAHIYPEFPPGFQGEVPAKSAEEAIPAAHTELPAEPEAVIVRPVARPATPAEQVSESSRKPLPPMPRATPPPRGSRLAAIRAAETEEQRRELRRQLRESTRKRAKPRFTLVTIASAIRSMSVMFAAAVIVATVFMWAAGAETLPPRIRANDDADSAVVSVGTPRRAAATRTPLPTPVWYNRVGILAGHTGIAERGPNKGNDDPGAVCEDGFFEKSVTAPVADLIVAAMRSRGYEVDLLEEFDMDLFDYKAAAFISLHADSCVDYGYGGFKSTYPFGRTIIREQDERFDECVQANYGALTGMEFRADNITPAMQYYHAFNEIAPSTPAVILELGFLSFDRNLLQNRQDLLAQAVVNGLICFLEPKAPPTATVIPTITPTAPMTIS